MKARQRKRITYPRQRRVNYNRNWDKTMGVELPPSREAYEKAFSDMRSIEIEHGEILFPTVIVAR